MADFLRPFVGFGFALGRNRPSRDYDRTSELVLMRRRPRARSDNHSCRCRCRCTIRFEQHRRDSDDDLSDSDNRHPRGRRRRDRRPDDSENEFSTFLLQHGFYRDGSSEMILVYLRNSRTWDMQYLRSQIREALEAQDIAGRHVDNAMHRQINIKWHYQHRGLPERDHYDQFNQQWPFTTHLTDRNVRGNLQHLKQHPMDGCLRLS